MVETVMLSAQNLSTKQLAYRYGLIHAFQKSAWSKGSIHVSLFRTLSFKNSFLSYAIKEWNKLGSEIRNAETYALFWKRWNSTRNTTYNIYGPLGIKLLTRLRLGFSFSYLSEQKFRYSFADSLNLLRSCFLETETRLHFFLRSQNYTTLSVKNPLVKNFVGKKFRR